MKKKFYLLNAKHKTCGFYFAPFLWQQSAAIIDLHNKILYLDNKIIDSDDEIANLYDKIINQLIANEPPSGKLETRLEEIHRYAPRDGQLKAIRYLFEDHNVFFSARTSYGKSMNFYLQLALKPNIISLLIMPLNILEVDQASVIKKINAKVSPSILNVETMNKDSKLLNRIKLNMYTHVLTSSKLALLNKSIREVSQTPSVTNLIFQIRLMTNHNY